MTAQMNNIIRRAMLLAVFNATIFSVSSCDGKRVPEASKELSSAKESSALTSESENFDKFVEDFFKKSDFQIERIAFPVSNLIYDTDSEKFDSTSIKKEDWKYWNIYKQKNVVLKTLKNDTNEAVLNAQIKETGVSVNYIFNLTDGKWYLVKIIDEST